MSKLSIDMYVKMPRVKVNKIKFLILAQIICFNEDIIWSFAESGEAGGETAAALLLEAYRVIKH